MSACLSSPSAQHTLHAFLQLSVLPVSCAICKPYLTRVLPSRHDYMFYSDPHCTDKETEAEKDEINCPISYSF